MCPHPCPPSSLATPRMCVSSCPLLREVPGACFPCARGVWFLTSGSGRRAAFLLARGFDGNAVNKICMFRRETSLNVMLEMATLDDGAVPGAA